MDPKFIEIHSINGTDFKINENHIIAIADSGCYYCAKYCALEPDKCPFYYLQDGCDTCDGSENAVYFLSNGMEIISNGKFSDL